MPIHVFRYDDFSTTSCTELEAKLVDLLLKLRVPCAFGVIPFACDPEALVNDGEVRLRPLSKSKADLLKPLVEAGLAEIALHGYCHLTLAPLRGYQEFSDRMPSETQQSLILRGRRHLEEVFGVKVGIYVPPWNRLATSTAAVLQQEGLVVAGDVHQISSFNEFRLPQLPCATVIADTECALKLARRFGADSSIVGTMLHDYDFAESKYGRSELDLAGFESLLVRWDQMQGVRRQSIGQTLLGFTRDEADRRRANHAFQQALQRSRVGGKVMRQLREIYWDAKTANTFSTLLRIVP